MPTRSSPTAASASASISIRSRSSWPRRPRSSRRAASGSPPRFPAWARRSPAQAGDRVARPAAARHPPRQGRGRGRRDRALVRHCLGGQAEVGRLSVEGVREIELFTAAQATAQNLAGAPIEYVCDMLVNERTAEVCCPVRVAGNEHLRAGGVVVSDVSVRDRGYWGDSARSFVGTNEEAAEAYAVISEILDDAAPGARARARSPARSSTRCSTRSCSGCRAARSRTTVATASASRRSRTRT